MAARLFSFEPVGRSRFRLALALSFLLHGLLLLIPQHAPVAPHKPALPLQARLAPPGVLPALPPSPSSQAASNKPSPRKSVLSTEKPNSRSVHRAPEPKWSAAEKNEMNKFLDELATPSRPVPTLAQRSLAMARELSRAQAQQSEAALDAVERVPNSPPVDPFGLEMYMDALVKKLNRSAAFVRNDPRSKGLRVATVQLRLNPNGSLKSFRILNAADQEDEIAFIKRVVEQAVPFAAFPGDIQRSAQSLSMIICIMPARTGEGGFGFTRRPDGRGC